MGGGYSLQGDERYVGVVDFERGTKERASSAPSTPKTAVASDRRAFDLFYEGLQDTTAFALTMGFDLNQIEDEREKRGVGRFLRKVYNDEALLAWVAQKRDNVDGPGVFLSLYHLQKTVGVLNAQENLPEGVMDVLADFLNAKVQFEAPDEVFDFKSRIRYVSDGCASTLPRRARENEQLRHDLAHALKLEDDVMRFDLVDDTQVGQLVRALKSCMIRLHDEKQKNKLKNTSNEELTAVDVEGWLIEALEVPDDNHDVRAIINYLSHLIIVCGTSLVWGKNIKNPDKPVNTNMDLLELLFVLQASLKRAGHDVCSQSNEGFVRDAYITTTLTAVFDKVEVASRKRCEDNPVTCQAIKDYLGRNPTKPLMLERFFATEDVVPYHHVTSAGVLDEAYAFDVLDEKTLLMGLVPNLTMATETAYFDPALGGVDVKSQWDKESTFLNTCHAAYTPEPTPEFAAVFKAAFDGVASVMHTLFFERIDKEQAFALSQVNGLIVLRNALLDLGMPLDAVQAIVNPEVPKAHARNLSKLQSFYGKLETLEEKEALAEELGMVLVLQKGAQLAFNLRASMDRRKEVEKAMSEASSRIASLDFNP